MGREELIQHSIRQKQAEDSIKQEFEQTLADRVARYLQVSQAGIIPNHYFAAASTECIFLFRDGHFYGCISLVQAVAEAIIKFLCQKNSWKPCSNFEENVNNLFVRGFISERLKGKFLEIWGNRDDYHHLNSTVEVDRQKLTELARGKICLLAETEKEIFNFAVNPDGSIAPKQPKYWEGTNCEVFLRLE